MTQEEPRYETPTKQTFIEEDSSPIIEINEYKRLIIFITLVLVGTLSSCDGGIIPQQNKNLKTDFGGGGEARSGLFGSIDYIGRVVGALIFTSIMGKYNRKMMLVITLIFKALTLFVPLIKISDTFYYFLINIVARCLSGLSQVFYPTYLPVWCDQYANKNNKAIWVTLVQIGNPIGIIIGYGIGLLCEAISEGNGWRIAFPIEGVSLIVLAFIIFLFDKI